jgi:uncharacterized protein YaiI (UPF0178 family)
MLRKADFFNIFILAKFRGFRTCHRNSLPSIGGAIATRAIMADLRAGMDGIGGGPAPFAKADQSRFLQALDEALVRLG